MPKAAKTIIAYERDLPEIADRDATEQPTQYLRKVEGADEKALVIERLREAVLPLLADGRVTVPVQATFQLERTQEAYETFARPGKFGKLVLLP